MSLIGALNLGKSALAVQQAALQVTGNNISNAGNADYTRQSADVSPSPDQQIAGGFLIGTGIDLNGIQRQVDDALNARIRGSVSDNQSASTTADWMGQVQSVFNALSGTDLSSTMSTFFNSWSNLANNPQDSGLRQVVLQDGQAVASQFNSLNTSFAGLRSNLSDQLTGLVGNASQLAQQVADLNKQISTAEGGGSGQANALRDQRDAVLKQLSQLVNIQTVDQGNGVTNVYVGSEPLVVNTTARGLAVKQSTVNGKLLSSVIFKDDNGTAIVSSGQIGALVGMQSQINSVSDQLDGMANTLIFQLNKLHSSGQSLNGLTSATSTNQVLDPTVPLNNAKAGLAFTPTNGSFVVHMTDKSTGLSTSTLVQVDLDGLNNNDTTLNGLAAKLNAIPNLQASVVGGQLKLQTSSSTETMSFSQDSSGVLAALGINSFFTGKDAMTIAVNSTVAADPSNIAAAKNGDQGDNQTALAISQMESTSFASLSNQSLTASYRGMIDGIGTGAATAKTDADATQQVQQTLEAQRQSLSGVSLDEEAVNLIQQQRAFQGTARFVSTVDQMMQTLLQM